MDLSTILGVVAALGLVMVGIGSGLKNFWDLKSIFIVVGGTFAVLAASHPLPLLKDIPRHLKIVIKRPPHNPMIYIDEIVKCAQIARKSGLLALEEYANEESDQFLKSSLLLIVDAIDANKVRAVLEDDLSYMEKRHAEAMSFYERGAAFAPAFGMIGTLIGLILMLKGLDLDSGETKTLTDGMGVALITTFYGSMLANIFFSPMANKLQSRHEQEMLCKEIIIEGVLSIQSGENPKFIREKLISFLSEDLQQKDGESEGGENGQEDANGKKAKKEKKKPGKKKKEKEKEKE